MKFALEDIVATLKNTKVNPDTIDTVAKKLEELAEELKKEKDAAKTARSKKKLYLLNPKDTATYYVAQAEVDDDLSGVVAKLQKSIGDYNARAKKKKVEITNNAEAIEFIPNKILKENGLIIKTKEPCAISNV